jgi:ferric iron reductase protein FhuF
VTRRATLATLATVDPLDSVRDTVAAMAARPDLPALVGLAPGLTATVGGGWVPATALVDGAAIDDFLDTARRRWDASPHAAAALAWKCYTYWLALPAVLGYAVARRTPLVRPDAVVVRWSQQQPFVVVGLTAPEVAVAPADPIALDDPAARVRVMPVDEMMTELRLSLVDEHLSPMLERIRDRVHLGHRTLWGSVASGVAYALSRAADFIPAPVLPTTYEILSALRLDDLVDLSAREDGRPGLNIQRRTCCLAFTLPEPKICSGCCIR